MKKLLILFVLGASAAITAQPVVTSSTTLAPIGFSSGIAVSVPTTPGMSGANQTWDYSGLAISNMGTYTIIDPATSPFISTFSSATHSMHLNLGGAGNRYTYFRHSSNQFEELASSINAPGSGNDYSPNPSTRLIFPMNFGDTYTDTWQKVNGSPESVVITYDAYGTFITPYNTYSNVIRIANDYGNNDIDYSWFLTSPLRLLAVHKHSDNTIILIDGAGLSLQSEKAALNVEIYPNPTSEELNIDLFQSGMQGEIFFQLYNIVGVLNFNTILGSGANTVKLTDLPAGIYVYRISDDKGNSRQGKIQIL